MQNGLTISFRHIQHSPELIRHIESEAIKLRERHFNVNGINVVIESPNRRHHSNNNLRVNVLVSVRGRRLYASRRALGGEGSQEARAVVSAAFDAIESEVNTVLQRSQKKRWPTHPAQYSFAPLREERSWVPY